MQSVSFLSSGGNAFGMTERQTGGEIISSE